jgi:hypothetical protein
VCIEPRRRARGVALLVEESTDRRLQFRAGRFEFSECALDELVCPSCVLGHERHQLDVFETGNALWGVQPIQQALRRDGVEMTAAEALDPGCRRSDGDPDSAHVIDGLFQPVKIGRGGDGNPHPSGGDRGDDTQCAVGMRELCERFGGSAK